MQEKEPMFTVIDKRKFTTGGELRPGLVASEVPPELPKAVEAPAAPVGVLAAAHEAAHPEPNVALAEPADAPVSATTVDKGAQPDDEAYVGEDGLPEPTAQESAEQHTAYQESSKSLDELIAKQNPAARATGPMTFDRLVQSVYMTAAMQLGAGGQPGEQPRVDILGARQSIDMLAVLGEKTKGNLTESEQRLLQNALFELRMSFLEITNAIAISAAQGPPPPSAGARPGFRPGGR